MKLEYRLLLYGPELQFTSFHLFPLSSLQYKTTGDALMVQEDKEIFEDTRYCSFTKLG
jgi:hypothetical protein